MLTNRALVGENVWNMAKDLTAIRIDGKLIEQLKRISAESDGLYYDRSVNWLIGRAVEEFIERHPKRAAKQADKPSK